jgi:glycolate oxidase FAD binding subunit
VDEVTAVLHAAADAGVAVMPWGGGTAVSVGAPASRAALVLGLRRFNRLIEHEPGDLTATAEAGIPFASLQTALRARGQWLSLDPADEGRATLGGVLAANAAGPRRHLYGTARDLLIGVTVVTADGEVVRGGGKVVKNVAGYDLPKLFVGSYGTLGIVVDATVKLRPVPDAEALVAVPFEQLKDGGGAVRAVAASDLIPNAVELLDPSAAAGLWRAVGLDALPGGGGRVPGALLVLGFDGLEEQVEAQVADLGKLLTPLGGREVVPLPATVWPRLSTAARDAWETPAALMRFAVLPTLVPETMEHGAGLARQRGLRSAWAAHAGVGVVSASLFTDRPSPETGPIAATLDEWRGMAHTGGGHAVLEWAPLSVKTQVSVWDDLGAAGRIMQRIKTQLDSRNVLNPGRFVAGI